MAPHHILQLNAAATGASAIALLAARGLLYPLFGLASPLVLDLVAAGFLAYAGALAVAARARPVGRGPLLAFTAGDALYVAGSAIVLLLFWDALAPLARALIIAVALVVEVFATLQYRAAGGPRTGRPLTTSTSG